MSSNQDAIADGVVLVVEEWPDLRAALSTALQVRNIDHQQFEDVEKVDALLASGNISRPTCMLLDIRLGNGPTGLSLFHTIKELGLQGRIPVIFMTGHGELDTAVGVMRDGARLILCLSLSRPQTLLKRWRMRWPLLRCVQPERRQSEGGATAA